MAGEIRGTTDGVAWIVSISTPLALGRRRRHFHIVPWKVEVAEDRPDGRGQALETIVLGPKAQ